MDKYFSAYNDVDDDPEDGEELVEGEEKEIVFETKADEEAFRQMEDGALKEGEDYVIGSNEDDVGRNKDVVVGRNEDDDVGRNEDYDVGRNEYEGKRNENWNNEDKERKDLGDEELKDEDDEDEESKDEDDEDEDFVISDDDQDFFRLRKRSRDETNEDAQEENVMVLEAKIPKRTVTSRLVSYGEDDEDEEANEQQGDEEEAQEKVTDNFDFTEIVIGTPHDEVGKEDQLGRPEERADHLTRIVKLPPRVAVRCSKAMQDKVTFLHKKVTQEGMDLNFSIQGKKNFRNPSIYEKLLEYCRIDEQGTNYPAHLYNPRIFGPESNYKALAEAQNENERRKKEMKQKRSLEKSQGAKKTSKWDNPVVNIINNINNANNNNNIEDTSIKKVPSVGSLIKNKSS